jgi:succinate-semialdehyde dehydrogenase
MSISSATHAVSVNPATGNLSAALGQPKSRRGEACRQGYRQWRKSVNERAQARAVGVAPSRRSDGAVDFQEMGKPIAQARGEVAKSANLCDWYAEHGPAMLG